MAHLRCPKSKRAVGLLKSAEVEGNEKLEKNALRLVRESFSKVRPALKARLRTLNIRNLLLFTLNAVKNDVLGRNHK